MHVAIERELCDLWFQIPFYMINKRQKYTFIISKETQLNIILSNALPLSLTSLVLLSFKKFENENVNLAILAPHTYETET